MKKFEVISEFSPKGDQPNAIKKLKNGDYDAIILSYAGIKNLNLENEIAEVFSLQEIMLVKIKAQNKVLFIESVKVIPSP